jgi:hypothetical protein
MAWALWLLVSVGGAAAADRLPRLDVEGPRDGLLSFTLRGVEVTTEPIVKIQGLEARIVSGSLRLNPDGSGYFEAELPAGIKPGRVSLEVVVGDKVIRPEPFLEIPNPLLEAGMQPLIHRVEPVGGLPSATIKVHGRNFGSTLKNVYLTVGNENTLVFPIFISKPDEQGFQELVFAIPSDRKDGRPNPDFQQILNRSSICNYALLSLTVSGRPANWESLNVVHPNGLWRVAGLSAALVFLLLSPLLAVCCWQLALGIALFLGAYLLFTLHSDLCWILAVAFLVLALAALRLSWARRDSFRPIVRTLFIDSNTGTYSLSKVQAFAWTVVIIGSYFYFAIGRGILVGRAEMPDVNAGLIGLLSISYGGLLISRGISRRKPKNDFAPTPPRWTNLITEGNSVSITRLQLIGFTIAGIAVYVFYVSGNEVFFRGMPEIPPTLNGLLAVSQGGYLGGKIVADTAVNYIVPMRARAGETLSIFGVGFLDKTKLLVQGVREAMETELINANCLKVKLPDEMAEPGLKQIVFIPPTGASFPVSEAFELIDPKILDLDASQPRRVSFTLRGIDLAPEELRAGIGDLSLEVIRKERDRFTLESAMDLVPGSTLWLRTAEGDKIGTAVI